MRKNDASLFQHFNEARSFAGQHARGYPGWRVTDTGNGYMVELIPGAVYLQRIETEFETRCWTVHLTELGNIAFTSGGIQGKRATRILQERLG